MSEQQSYASAVKLTEQDVAGRKLQIQLRQAAFGAGPRSDRLARAIEQIYIQVESTGYTTARALDASGDLGADAAAWALAHRLEMGQDQAASVGLSMADEVSWAKIGATLLMEHTVECEDDKFDWLAIQDDAQTIISAALKNPATKEL